MKRSHNKKTGKLALTAKEQVFVNAYVREPNAAKAARAAGYKSVLKVAAQLIQRPPVRDEIDRRQALLRDREDFNLNKLMDWSVEAATFDIGEIFREDTFEILPPAKWPNQRLRHFVQSFKTTYDEKTGRRKSVEVKFGSRSQHLDRIALLMGVGRNSRVKAEARRPIPPEVVEMLTKPVDREGG